MKQYLISISNWLNSSLDDSKYRHFCKYVLPITALFFTWGFIGHVIMIMNLDTNSLKKNQGRVNIIATGAEYRRTISYPCLNITLKNNSASFRLSDAFEENYSYIQHHVSGEDSITIYTRYDGQILLGMGREEDIYQIDKEGETIFELSKVISEQKSQSIWFAIACLISWALYYICWIRKGRFYD